MRSPPTSSTLFPYTTLFRSYHAGRYYLGEGRGWARKFSEDDSKEGIIKALQETDYGVCVFQSNNNVVDHQVVNRSEEHTSELQSRGHLVCRLLLEKKKNKQN